MAEITSTSTTTNKPVVASTTQAPASSTTSTTTAKPTVASTTITPASTTTTTSTAKPLTKPVLSVTAGDDSFKYAIEVPASDKDTSYTINYTETGNPNWAHAQVTSTNGTITGTRNGHELTVNVVAHSATEDSVNSDNVTVTPVAPTTTTTSTVKASTTTSTTSAPVSTTSTTVASPTTTSTTTEVAHSGFYSTWVFLFNMKAVTAEYLRQDVQDPTVSKNPYNYLALTPEEYTTITGVQWDSSWNTL